MPTVSPDVRVDDAKGLHQVVSSAEAPQAGARGRALGMWILVILVGVDRGSVAGGEHVRHASGSGPSGPTRAARPRPRRPRTTPPTPARESPSRRHRHDEAASASMSSDSSASSCAMSVRRETMRSRSTSSRRFMYRTYTRPQTETSCSGPCQAGYPSHRPGGERHTCPRVRWAAGKVHVSRGAGWTRDLRGPGSLGTTTEPSTPGGPPPCDAP